MDKEREENSVKAGQTMQEIQLNMDIKEQGAGKMPRKEWMKMQIESRSENEEFARVTVAVFMSRMDPTLEEINDVKTAVSEAVTNCVIHGYGNGEGIIYIEAGIEEDELSVWIRDEGKGIEDIRIAMEPMYTSDTSGERSGMGFSFMEAFMDQVEVESEPGRGTMVKMKRKSAGDSMDETMKLIEMAHSGDKAARERLVMDNVGLVWSIVRRFTGRGCETEDLFQIGSIGLIKAIDKFDTSYDVRFSTYAVPMITGEIKRFLRDDGMIKVSRSIKELGFKVSAVRESLSGSLGREPTLEEISEALEVSKEEVAASLEAGCQVESLYAPSGSGEDNTLSLIDKVAEEKEENEMLLDRMVLGELLKSLEKKQREIIVRRYFYNQTQTQIAEILGISQVQVSRMERKILREMREKL